jgi:hypothetical protein
MKAFKIKIQFIRIICVLHFAFCVALSQSTEQKFPTLVKSNEISGKISARDIGDSRLTTYYYAFNGTQGDIFLTIESKNLNGDIDVFTVDELRPITKIALFAESSGNQTVRTIYLRKDEKLILRIEGKTPNDDDATFKIKFEGSFQPIADTETVTDAPKVKAKNDTDVIVNSVGTIIEVKAKPTPTPKLEIAKVEKPKTPKEKRPAKTPKKEKEIPTVDETPTTSVTEMPTTTVDETKDVGDAPNTQKPSIKPPKTNKPKVEITKTEKPKKPAKLKVPPKIESASALENVKLLVELKDGTNFERPMSEVLRVNVDKDGTLTIVTKDGKIGRYSILDVAKMTIQ